MPILDWSRLKRYNIDKRKSFEELCYQLAKRKYGHMGSFTSVDDSGGGDGVEFYLTQPDGSVWGWQAKFYWPDVRLDVSSRKSSITKSLEKSLKVHPNLTRWFLCTPADLTPAEKTWLESIVAAAGPTLEHEPWGLSEFGNMISEPSANGILHYFFGELELAPSWFDAQVKKQLANVKEKYLPPVHTETDVDRAVGCLLGDDVFSNQATVTLDEISSLVRDFDGALVEARSSPALSANVDAFQSSGYQVSKVLKAYLNIACDLVADLVSGRVGLAKNADLRSSFDSVNISWNEFDKQYEALDAKSDEALALEVSRGELKKHEIEGLATSWAQPLKLISNALNKAVELQRKVNILQSSSMHILGRAGLGKTHLSCHLCDERVSRQLPAILLPAKLFVGSQTIEKRINEILDVPASYSWNDLRDALTAYAEAAGVRIPICVDGLNESVPVSIWQDQLAGFEFGISSSPWLVLITTCRETYVKPIWGQRPTNWRYIRGFEDQVEIAVARYFDYFKLKADVTFDSQEQFAHPIYLRIFCETQNRKREQIKHVHIGHHSLFKVFDEYLRSVNDSISERLARAPQASIVCKALDKLGLELFTDNARSIPLERAFEVIDGQPINQADWNRSITKALLDEGLLIGRDWLDDCDAITFPYDLLAGYTIACALIDAFRSGRTDSRLSRIRAYLRLFRRWRKHPLADDILRSICALAPEKLGSHLYSRPYNRALFMHSVEALFEMDPTYVCDAEQKFLAQRFEYPQDRRPLLRLARSVAFVAHHPLNAHFWDQLLYSLPAPDRDISWTLSIWHQGEDTQNIERLLRFEHACKIGLANDEVSQSRLHLGAIWYSWMLTSNVRRLRDHATRALYWYGRIWPNELFSRTVQMLGCNDPYVPERLLAACYGVIMARHQSPDERQFVDSELPAFAKNLYDLMFAPDAEHATTHILMRDYARQSIEAALIHEPNLLSAEQQAHTRPPYQFGGIREWGEAQEADKQLYTDGNAPIQMDFGNYTIGRLVPDRSNYDYNNPEYRSVYAQIVWRMYSLGYSVPMFGNEDSAIARSRNFAGRNDGNSERVDRFGKKYSWIAYHELHGYLSDLGKLRDEWWTESKYRSGELDIDPSFPEQPEGVAVISDDILGDRGVATREWIDHGPVPPVAHALHVDRVAEESGPWVMLDGFIHQTDDDAERHSFVFIRGLLIKLEDRTRFIQRIQKQYLGDRWLPEIPESFNTFAGEIPWSASWQANGHNTLWGLWDEAGQARTIVPNSESGMQVLLPVRQWSIPSGGSAANRAAGFNCPTKEISEVLGLWIRLPDCAMLDLEGKRAVTFVEYGSESGNSQRATYIRLEHLGRFIDTEGFAFYLATWGERAIWKTDLQVNDFDGWKPYRVFQSIHELVADKFEEVSSNADASSLRVRQPA